MAGSNDYPTYGKEGLQMSALAISYDERRFTQDQNRVITRAFEFGLQVHGDQRRASGEPFFSHPVAVAQIVAEWGLDHETVAAALLHDVVEDTEVTESDLTKNFGPAIAGLVEGVTKLRLSAHPRLSDDSRPASSENLRKLLLASTKDIRVLLLKLADRLHNLRTLEYLPAAKQKQIARESLEIFAPLADRLGMGLVKGEMEDLGFRFAMPEEYQDLVHRLKLPTRQAQAEVETLKRAIAKLLGDAGIAYSQIEGRRKHYYSIYKKLAKVDGDIDKIYDLVAIRVIVPTVADCYQALGILHQSYKPLINRIKDYIAVPKPNGYQSLHTTVFGLKGRITEIQIRTQSMHEEAEHGLAAHFFYDQQKNTKTYTRRQTAPRTVPHKLGWVRQLGALAKQAGSLQEFAQGAKLELFVDQIYVFSPKGDLYELPDGATPLDFAFTIHSGVGLRALGARVNGKMASLDGRLENRDVVEIITRKEPMPSRDWLNFVVTSTARNRIKAWFRATSRESNILAGRQILEQALAVWDVKKIDHLPKRLIAETLDLMHIKDIDELYAQLAEGGLAPGQIIRRLIPDAARPANAPVVKRQAPTGRVRVAGDDLSYGLAPCCHPVYPQSLVGYITRGKGVTVHVLGCRNVPNDAERLVACHWETSGEVAEQVVVWLKLRAANRVGLVADITGVVARRGLSLAGISSDGPGSGDEKLESDIRLGIELPDMFVLPSLMRRLQRIPGMLTVQRG
jgi:GTP pyrophosphokinase